MGAAAIEIGEMSKFLTVESHKQGNVSKVFLQSCKKPFATTVVGINFPCFIERRPIQFSETAAIETSAIVIAYQII